MREADVGGGGDVRLPVQLTSFVGREDDVARVTHLLGQTRLLTLSGPGGCGKTRLAIEVARIVGESFADGVRFLDLTQSDDEVSVERLAASALGLSADDAHRVVEALSGREVLIVLDNCEHVLEPASELVLDVLAGCPDVSILATSREPLGVSAETVWRVPSLSVPSEQPSSTDHALRSDAFRLFVERARKARPDLDLDLTNATLIAEICRRVDGVPLALELAAARLRTLTLRQVADDLADRVAMLGIAGKGSSRHRTLRACLNWSYELLSEEERVVLRRLGTFPGTFDATAAREVCGFGVVDPDAVTEIISALVDRSLVVATFGDERRAVRYRLLEVVRAYALEQLDHAGESDVARERHAAHYFHELEATTEAFFGPHGHDVAERFETDYHNVVTAVERALLVSPVTVLETVPHLAPYCIGWGRTHQARHWLQTALERAGDEHHVGRGRAFAALTLLCYGELDHELWGLINKAVSEFRAAGADAEHDRWFAIALAFMSLLHAFVHAAIGIDEAPTTIVEMSDEALHHAGTDTVAELWASFTAGWARFVIGDRAAGRAQAMNALEVARRRDLRGGIDFFLTECAWLAMVDADVATARALLEESVAIAGHRVPAHHQQQRLTRLAFACLELGDSDSARRHVSEAFDITERAALTATPSYAWLRQIAAELAVNEGDLDGALHHIDAALMLADGRSRAYYLPDRGDIMLRANRVQEADFAFKQALSLSQQPAEGWSPTGYVPLPVADALSGLARIALIDGKLHRAARLLGAAEANVADVIRTDLTPHIRAEHDRALREVNERLGEGRFRTEMHTGRGLSSEEAVAYGLQMTDGPEMASALIATDDRRNASFVLDTLDPDRFPGPVADALVDRARTAWVSGDETAAERDVHSAVAIYAGIDDDRAGAEALVLLARVFLWRNSPRDAARLVGVAESLGSMPDDDLVDELRAALSAEFDGACKQGAMMPFAKAAAYAAKRRGARKRPTTGWESLTPIEQDIARLVACGMTNPQIGERLFISKRTVQSHLARIFPKLGVTSRSELAAVAVRSGSSHPAG